MKKYKCYVMFDDYNMRLYSGSLNANNNDILIRVDPSCTHFFTSLSLWNFVVFSKIATK